MNMNAKNIIKAVLLTLALGIGIYITMSLTYGSSALLPDCFGYITGGYGKTMFLEIQKIGPYLDDISINAQAFLSGYVRSSTGVTVPVEIIATDANYTDFHSINMTKGAFFSDSQGESGVVISETLANALFKSIDIVGARFYLFDTEVAVAGVYKPDRSFLTQISSDGKDYMIIPCNLGATQNTDVDYLYIGGKADETTLNRLLGGKLGNYTKVNLSENKKVIMQFNDILVFLLGTMIFVVLFGRLCKLISAMIRMIGEKNNRNMGFYIKMGITVTILVATAYVASFDLYIPAGFFPADRNILNIPHYIGLFIDFVQAHNTDDYYFYSSLYFWSVLLIVPTIFINLLLSSKVISKILTIVRHR